MKISKRGSWNMSKNSWNLWNFQTWKFHPTSLTMHNATSLITCFCSSIKTVIAIHTPVTTAGCQLELFCSLWSYFMIQCIKCMLIVSVSWLCVQASPRVQTDEGLVKDISDKLDQGNATESIFDAVQAKVIFLSWFFLSCNQCQSSLLHHYWLVSMCSVMRVVQCTVVFVLA